MKSQVRSFIAIEISPQVRSEIARCLKKRVPGTENIKWVTQDLFHLTLKFLGDVPMTEIHHVIEAVNRACTGVEPFDLVFEGLGAFPDMEKPRTLWVGVSEGIEESISLADRIDDELEKLGFSREARKFTPHLTIGRVKSAKDLRAESHGARNVDSRGARRYVKGKKGRLWSDDDPLPVRTTGTSGADNAGSAGSLGNDPLVGAREFLRRAAENPFFGISSVEGVTLFSSELSRSGPKYEALAEIEFQS